MDFYCKPARVVEGDLTVPGDKSISHRAVMFAAVAEGASEIRGFLAGEDCLATLRAFAAMGVAIEQRTPSHLLVKGVGLNGLTAAKAPLDLGNSGTSMRLLAGLLAAQPFASTLTGDASLRRRPMRRVTEPLTRMGADIRTSEAGTAPVDIAPPARPLQGIQFTSPVASAQVKSAVLLAGLYAEGVTEISEPHRSRDHSERMLRAFGVRVESLGDDRVMLAGGQRLTATDIDVPGDISSAAFFLVAAAISPGSRLRLRGIGLNPTRTGVIDILSNMGADIVISNHRQLGGEPVGDIDVRGGRLRGIDIEGPVVASAIDEFPAIFVAAACATGETRIRDAAELRVKESDRIQSMVEALRACGISAVAHPDGASILGGRLRGGTVDARGDHRVAMSMAVASLRAEQPILIRDCANVQTSFPGFVESARQAGLDIRVRTTDPRGAGASNG